MTSTTFIYFLQGYLEVANPKTISEKEFKLIKGHLQLAFRDDIDKSYGDKEHQAKLTAAHKGLSEPIFNENPEVPCDINTISEVLG